jgi:hypothetical protein
VGKRSAAGAYPIFDYRTISMPDTIAAVTENTLVVCMIETPEGLENVEAIAAVEGVDVIHVGANDLLTAMGKPGAYGSPEHIAALDRVFAAAKKHGKIPGVGGDRNLQRQMDSIRKGAQFLTTNSDIAFMMAEAARRNCRASVVHFRGCGGTPNRLPRAYHSGVSAEIDWTLRRLRMLHEGAIYAAGVSLGGNALLKWLGEQGDAAASLISSAAAVR